MESLADEKAVLAEVCRVLQPKGFYFLDLANGFYVQANLVSRDEQIIQGKTFIQEREIVGDRVVKTIRIREKSPESPEDTTERVFYEKLKLFDYSSIQQLLQEFPLQEVAVFGDESGGAWTQKSSRLSLLLQRK